MLQFLFAAPLAVAASNMPSSLFKPRATSSGWSAQSPWSIADSTAYLRNDLLADHRSHPVQLAPQASVLLRSPAFLSTLTMATTLFLLALTWRYHSYGDRSAKSAWRKLLAGSGITEKSPPPPALETPPVVAIPAHIQFSARGHAAYADALDRHGNGDVVVIPRHGRMEYVVDHRHVRDVLTDAQSYSFEKAVTNMLHMEFMLWFKQGTFVQELDKLVQDGVTPRLRAVVEKVAPVFAQEAQRVRQAQQASADQTHAIDDVYVWVHRAIAQAMVILIFGERYLTTTMTEDFMAIVVAIANLSGIYENTQGWRRFPKLWSLCTTLKAIFGTVVPRFLFRVLPTLWRNRSSHLNHGMDVEQNEYAAFFDLLLAKHRTRATDRISPLNFAWCATICLGIIFASIHQTAVVACWCIVALSQRQDTYLPALRQEWNEHVQVDADGHRVMTVENLKQCSLLDSFIREVMRTKGDTFAPVRFTVQDVRVGKYVIPKNSLCAPYVKRTHEHPANYGDAGTTFDGFQWHHKQRPAVQSGPDFISFGLGRWACPGRHLAIAEIKMVLLSLFGDNDVHIRPDSFRVTDPMNTTSVAPEAILDLCPLSHRK